MSSVAKKPDKDDKMALPCEKLLMDEEKLQPTNVITAEDKNNSHIAGNDDVDCSYNANNVPAALPEQNCTSIDIPTAAPDQNCSSKNGKIAPTVQNVQNVCIFCLDEGGPEEGSLMHMCSCSVLTHKKCALEYIRFPGNMNDRCCQCREKLKFNVIDKKTPMKHKYVIAFTFLVIFYLTMVGVSIFLTMLMIPNHLNIYLYIAIVANLSILWPLLLVLILSFGIDGCFGPRDRSSSSWGGDPGCYCSGGCGDCGGGDCDCGGDGDACAIILCVLALLAILVILIVATVYLFMSLAKFYKSFTLKSKKEINFHHEGRTLYTLGNTKSTVGKLVTNNHV